MPSRSQSTTAQPRVPNANGSVVLYGGVDWLECSTHNMLCEYLRNKLAEEQALARVDQKERKVEFEIRPDHVDSPVSANLWLHPASIKGKFDFILRTDEIEICTRATKHHLEAMPNTMVRLRNEFLHRYGYQEAWARAESVMACLLQGTELDPPRWKISRVDLFADTQGIDLNQIQTRQWCGPRTLSMRQWFTAAGTSGYGANKSNGKDSYWDMAWDAIGRRDPAPGGRKRRGPAIISDTVEGGKGGIVFRCYDKTKEIAQSSGKWWMHYIWAEQPGWRGAGEAEDGLPVAAQPVVRVEYQLRREVLKELQAEDLPDGITTVSDLEKGFNRAWAYLSGHPGCKRNKYGALKPVPGWISLRAIARWKTGKERDRKHWDIHPWWKPIMDYAITEKPLTRTLRAKLRSAMDLYPQAAGLVAALAARLTAWKGGNPETTARAVLNPAIFEDKLPHKIAELLVRYQASKVEGGFDDSSRRIAETEALITQLLESGMISIDLKAIEQTLLIALENEFLRGKALSKTERLMSSMYGELVPELLVPPKLTLVPPDTDLDGEGPRAG